MSTAFEILRLVQLAVFGGLALLAVRRWIRRRGPAEAWLAATLSIIGAIVAVSVVLPREVGGGADELFRKVLIGILLLFPYMLFRFTVSMGPAPKAITRTVELLTVTAFVAPFAIDGLPAPGASRTPAWSAYLIVFLVQWVFTSGVAAVLLWSRGSGQSTVVRRRMRFLSTGAIGLTLGVIVSVAFGGAGDVDLSRIITQSIAILSAPMFLLGAAPPAAMVSLWRRDELSAMHLAERGLMTAQSAEQVGEALLRPTVQLVGGRAAVFVQGGRIIGSFGLAPEEREALGDAIGTRQDLNGDPLIEVAMRHGALIVVTSPYAPYFGIEEMTILEGFSLLADLALERVASLERERESAEIQRDFVAVASHDLRTPLAVIQGYTGLMEEHWATLSDDEKRGFNSTIDRQARHLSRLVNDLLMSSRLDAKALHPRPERVPIAGAVRAALEGLGEQAESVRVDVPGDLAASVDPEHLQRILVNLVTNAFAHGQPPVQITARASGVDVEIRVRDHGRGIAPDVADHLFQRFAQPRGTNGRATGTGLGLYIVHGLAAEAGGDVVFERPAVGTGACFVVRLPSASIDLMAYERKEIAT